MSTAEKSRERVAKFRSNKRRIDYTPCHAAAKVIETIAELNPELSIREIIDFAVLSFKPRWLTNSLPRDCKGIGPRTQAPVDAGRIRCHSCLKELDASEFCKGRSFCKKCDNKRLKNSAAYARNLLCKGSTVLSPNDIPDDLVAAKMLELKIHRLLKESTREKRE